MLLLLLLLLLICPCHLLPCHLLPCQALMVTNHDATMLPTKMANSLDGVGESVQVSDWVDAALPTWQHRPISPPSSHMATSSHLPSIAAFIASDSPHPLARTAHPIRCGSIGFCVTYRAGTSSASLLLALVTLTLTSCSPIVCKVATARYEKRQTSGGGGTMGLGE